MCLEGNVKCFVKINYLLQKVHKTKTIGLQFIQQIK